MEAEKPANLLNVSRCDVLTGARDLLMRMTGRNTFKEWPSLNVLFDGEEGADVGGPTREFFRLALQKASCLPIFDGPLSARIIVYRRKGKSIVG